MKYKMPHDILSMQTVCDINSWGMLTLDRRQSKTLILSKNVDQNSLETEFSICHLSPNWRQMAIKNTVSSDFLFTFIDC